jgi:hypothetical protein
VAEVYENPGGGQLQACPWLERHPHVQHGWGDGNAIFVGRESLSFSSRPLPGFGVFRRPFQLTAVSRPHPSLWQVPDWKINRARIETPIARSLGLSMHPSRPNTIRLERQYVGDDDAVVTRVVCQRVTYCDAVYVHHTGPDGSVLRSRLEPECLRVTGVPAEFDCDAGWNWIFSYYVHARGRQILRVARIDLNEVRFVLG